MLLSNIRESTASCRVPLSHAFLTGRDWMLQVRISFTTRTFVVSGIRRAHVTVSLGPWTGAAIQLDPIRVSLVVKKSLVES